MKILINSFVEFQIYYYNKFNIFDNFEKNLKLLKRKLLNEKNIKNKK